MSFSYTFLMRRPWSLSSWTLSVPQDAHAARVSEAAVLHEKIDSLLNKTSYDLLTAEVTLADQIKVRCHNNSYTD